MDISIQPQKSDFKHAGELPAKFDRHDPRSQSFEANRVDIDLRDCKFVRPQAALWCMVYLSLASQRGATGQLLVPKNLGVCMYLKSLGLFDALKDVGIEVDDRSVGAQEDEKVVLPITAFQTQGDVSDITNRAFERLHAMDVSAPGLAPVISELFSELALNAVQHSESKIGAFGCIQFYEFGSGPRFACAVADGGIGVLKSLQRNPELARRVYYDWDALELAVRERVSGTQDPHRGIGLYGVSEEVRQPGRSLLLHSGIGSLVITEELQTAARRTRLFPGTLAFLSIPA